MAEFILMLSKFIFLVKKVNGYRSLIYWYFRINRSGLFDKNWYLERNPDVVQAKVDPLLHYLRYGGVEGRDPGPSFSSNWYLDTYEDVKEVGVNPLVHYFKYGRKEGREMRPSKRNSESGIESDISLAKGRQPEKLLPITSGMPKIFCIGHNKTGTTSLEQVFKDFGYKVGVQYDAEILIDDWAVRDFRRIVEYCQSADFFQDIPFSLDFTYQILDYVFPGSKFILTVRNDADEWFQSLVRFHAKLMGVKGIPTLDDVKNFSYHQKGWSWIQQQRIFGVDESTLYDEKLYKSNYMNHNAQILEYFRFRPADLLVLNLSDPSAMESLCEFLGIEYVGQVMHHLNKSKE